MKRLLKMALLLLCGAFAGACDDDGQPAEPFLNVTANNIAGTWRLATWRGEPLAEGSFYLRASHLQKLRNILEDSEASDNGEPLAEGSFVYFEFVRKDQTFKLYQNLDSFRPVMKSGRFSITTDEKLGAAVLSGDYDHSLNATWAHRYVVRDLTQTSMKWIVTTDEGDVTVYERCDGIPEEILAVCGE